MHELGDGRDALPALLMLSPWGLSKSERWVSQGRAAAALDLLQRLRASGCFHPVLVMAAEQQDAERLEAGGARAIAPPAGPFHFGEALAHAIRKLNLTQFAYFGGGSAPLASERVLREAFGRFRAECGSTAVANNLHSTDWALLGAGEAVARLAHRFPTDNALGWVLSSEAGIPVAGLPATAATRLDIDTPTDLILAAGHPDLGPALTEFLQTAPESGLAICRAIRRVLRTPASRLSLIGRTSAHAWAQLEAHTQVWVRVFAEERGMLSSGRLGRNEVHSVLRSIAVHPETLVASLVETSDAVLWDTRVWMAAGQGWPTAADRFASDLGWEDQIADAGLRRLTRAIASSPIPILAGGHGAVAGGIYALLEAMQSENCA